MTQNYYLLYDGTCGFCNFWVQFILKRDKKNLFLFASLQSEFGQNFLKENHLSSDEFTTIYLLNKNKNIYWSKSDAVLKIAKIIGFPYHYLSFFNIIPKNKRDSLYLFISKKRHLMFINYCKIPEQKDLHKFIS